MSNEKQSFVFFGSGPVAAESLRLLSETFTVEAVITKPSTKAELVAAAPNTPVYCVNSKSELNTLFSEQTFTSKLGVLIDFGIIVSQKIIDYFPFGIINSHFSLLPELRGADPISFAILEGKEKTGVSLMLLVKAMDEGPILSIGEHILASYETTPELTQKLIALSYELLRNGIPKYLTGEIKPADQIYIEEEFQRMPSYTRKLTKQDGAVDWQKPAEIIEREIRAYAEWPKSYTTLGDVDCTITRARVRNKSGNPGEIFIADKKLCVYCGEKSLEIELIKPSGKKEMSSEAFLAGYKNRLTLK
jgi:methionyl-tRNA formyltransferase